MQFLLLQIKTCSPVFSLFDHCLRTSPHNKWLAQAWRHSRWQREGTTSDGWILFLVTMYIFKIHSPGVTRWSNTHPMFLSGILKSSLRKKIIINHRNAVSAALSHGGSYISPGSPNQVEHIDPFSFNTKKKTKQPTIFKSTSQPSQTCQFWGISLPFLCMPPPSPNKSAFKESKSKRLSGKLPRFTFSTSFCHPRCSLHHAKITHSAALLIGYGEASSRFKWKCRVCSEWSNAIWWAQPAWKCSPFNASLKIVNEMTARQQNIMNF